jgi:hypothetical protein
MKSRELFTDGWNSFWHVFLGILSIRFLVIVPIFVIYQLIHFYDKNLFVDIAEFFIGFFGIILFVFFLNSCKIKHSLVDESFFILQKYFS